jgi:hypothetical protein
MNNIIVVTGYKDVPDYTKRTGWARQPYARVVSSLSEVSDGEELWTGELTWTDADPEGRHPAGWRIDHNGRLLLVIEDREAAEKIYALREEIKAAEKAVHVA